MNLEPEIILSDKVVATAHEITRRRLSAGGIVWRAALMAILFLTFLPFVFLVVTSFKNTHQFYHTFWLPAWPPATENYVQAYTDLKIYVFNSLFVTAMSIAGILVFSLLTGFLFARYRFPGREVIYYLMLAMLMVPGVLMLIPQFVWVQRLGLLNTYWVMVLPYVSGMQIMGMFLFRAFFAQIDNSLFESAQIDGASMMRQLWHIALPLSKAILGVVTIMSALGVWNSFLWPLVTTSDESVMVLTVGMLRYTGRIAGQYGPMFAGYVISAIPLGILFTLFTRAFMKGITSGAIKA